MMHTRAVRKELPEGQPARGAAARSASLEQSVTESISYVLLNERTLNRESGITALVPLSLFQRDSEKRRILHPNQSNIYL
jgi:hypothetical protein